MRSKAANGRSAARAADERMAEVFHGLSQPLTTLECGLELALRYDTNLAQVRKRLNVLLEAAQVMHQRLLEARGLLGAGPERLGPVGPGSSFQQ